MDSRWLERLRPDKTGWIFDFGDPRPEHVPLVFVRF